MKITNLFFFCKWENLQSQCIKYFFSTNYITFLISSNVKIFTNTVSIYTNEYFLKQQKIKKHNICI